MDEKPAQPAPELVFLGSSGAIQIPAFFCSCATCETARKNPGQRRTRASIALVGQETVLLDASPDLELQLEREDIRQIQRIFLTHWHYDHVWGLGALGEAASCGKWPPVELYLPRQVAFHFDQELAWLRHRLNLHPFEPGDRFELPDAAWEVVKTTHTDHSVGFIVESHQRFAYLVDGILPPPETIKRLDKLDLLIVEATMDELVLPPGEHWYNFSLSEAISFWQQTGIPQCILTHLSCHGWKDNRLIAGLIPRQRLGLERVNPGLRFAFDGMRLKL